MRADILDRAERIDGRVEERNQVGHHDVIVPQCAIAMYR
jgi:hypothetical protein